MHYKHMNVYSRFVLTTALLRTAELVYSTDSVCCDWMTSSLCCLAAIKGGLIRKLGVLFTEEKKRYRYYIAIISD